MKKQEFSDGWEECMPWIAVLLLILALALMPKGVD